MLFDECTGVMWWFHWETGKKPALFLGLVVMTIATVFSLFILLRMFVRSIGRIPMLLVLLLS